MSIADFVTRFAQIVTTTVVVAAGALVSSSVYARCDSERAALSACEAQAPGCNTDRDCGSGQACVLGQCEAAQPACPPVTCIRYCTAYDWNGHDYTGCDGYADYCARSPNCLRRCTHYVWNGHDYTGCDQYEDVCSSGAPAWCN